MGALIPERLERGRLIYEGVAPEHGEDLAALMADPRVRATLWPFPTPPTAQQLQTRLAAWIDHWERHGFGLWVLRDRRTGEFVGRGGLEYNDIDGASIVEVAWAMMPAWWGQGLATELAHTSVENAFAALRLRELIAITLPHNTASRRVMEKSGFTYERDVIHVGLPHVLYAQRRG